MTKEKAMLRTFIIMQVMVAAMKVVPYASLLTVLLILVVYILYAIAISRFCFCSLPTKSCTMSSSIGGRKSFAFFFSTTTSRQANCIRNLRHVDIRCRKRSFYSHFIPCFWHDSKNSPVLPNMQKLPIVMIALSNHPSNTYIIHAKTMVHCCVYSLSLSLCLTSPFLCFFYPCAYLFVHSAAVLS